jgi:hypothetical protein
MQKEIGYYDDLCGMCDKDVTVTIYREGQTKWDCPICEYTNEVRMEL